MKFTEIESAIDRMRSDLFSELCNHAHANAGFDGRELIKTFEDRAHLLATKIRDENVFNVPVVLKMQKTEGRMAFALDPTHAHKAVEASDILNRIVNDARKKFATDDANGVQDVEFWETSPDYDDGVDNVDQFVISVEAYTNTPTGKDQYERCIEFIRESIRAIPDLHFYATRPWPGYHQGHQE